jgi:hypothetical protein
MQFLSMGLGGVLVHQAGKPPAFWLDGVLLAAAGNLGLALLRGHDFQRAAK